MNLFGRSILGRVFVYFILFSILLIVGIFAMYSANWQTVTLGTFASALLIFLLYFLLVYLYEIVRPLRDVLVEMKALLAGKKYRRIYTKRSDEIGVIAHFFNEVTKNFEKVSTKIQEGKRMTDELEIAGSIQRAILPPNNPNVPGLDIDAKTRPAVELGGDVFDFITSGKNTYIYIGDVTGHGVPAAIVMTMVNTLIRTLAGIYANAFDVIYNVNKLLKVRIKSTMFMTLLLLKWDQETEKMTYVGAGHEHIVVYKAGKGKCEITKTGGIALGMVPDNSKLIKEVELPLELDDVIVLFTDGITEGRNMSGEMYGIDRLIKAVELYAPQYGSDGIVHHVALDYSRFVGEHKQDDDVTLIASKYIGKGHKHETTIQGISTATMTWLGNEDANTDTSAVADAELSDNEVTPLIPSPISESVAIPTAPIQVPAVENIPVAPIQPPVQTPKIDVFKAEVPKPTEVPKPIQVLPDETPTPTTQVNESKPAPEETSVLDGHIQAPLGDDSEEPSTPMI
jgi:serine phosphatase RsbU (regulator of sigma subunit)